MMGAVLQRHPYLKVAQDLGCVNTVIHWQALWVPDIWAWCDKYNDGRQLLIVESALRKETRIYDLTTGIDFQFDTSPSGAAGKVYDITWKFGTRLPMEIPRPTCTSAVKPARTFTIENTTGRCPVLVHEGISELNDLVAVGESRSDDEVTSEDAITTGVRVLEWAENGFPPLIEVGGRILWETEIAGARTVTLDPGPDEDWMAPVESWWKEREDDWGPGFV